MFIYLYIIYTDTCIAAAPNNPHVRKTSIDAANHDLPLIKNSVHTVAGNN